MLSDNLAEMEKVVHNHKCGQCPILYETDNIWEKMQPVITGPYRENGIFTGILYHHSMIMLTRAVTIEFQSHCNGVLFRHCEEYKFNELSLNQM